MVKTLEPTRHLPVVLESVECPMGCVASDRILFRGRDRIHGREGEYPVVQCRTCGLMRTNPRPTAASIGYFYPDDYGPYLATTIDNDTHRGRMKEALVGALKKVIQFNAQRLPDVPIGRMLEIGCASGTFLDAMSRLGWEVEGIEPSQHASQLARSHGYHVFHGQLESAPPPTAPYDLIVGWMVLEHLHRPIDALRQLFDWSSPAAWMVISVPNAGSLEFSLFRDRWYALHLPAHLYHFTPHTLKSMLEKTGWQMRRVFHQRNVGNLMASLGYALQDRRLWPRLARWLTDFPEAPPHLHALFYPLALMLSSMGQTGRMTVWAQKQGA